VESEQATADSLRERSCAIARSLLEASPLGTALLDGDLRCVWVNPAFATMGGVAAGDALGRPLGDVAPDLAPHLVSLLRTTLDSGLPFVNVEIRAEPPGAPERTRRCLATSFLVQHPALAQPAVGVTLVELARGTSDTPPPDLEAPFRAIFERAAIGIGVLEWRGKAVRFNPAFCKMLGYSQDEFAGVGIQAVTHPDDYAADLEQFQRLMAGEIDHYHLPKRYIRKDGSVMQGQLTVSISRDPDGSPSLVISMIEDVTERRLAEVERARLIRELEDALRARDVFLTVAAHELRTPLTSLLLNLQVFQRNAGRTGRALSPEVPELKNAVRATEQLASLVETLLDVSRIADGRFTPELVTLDLSELARELLERSRSAADEAGCALRLDAAESVLVEADAFQLQVVLDKLLSNAVKFGAHKPIAVKVTRRDGVARLSVRDQGIGVAPEHRERIFEQFARGVPETQYGGLGLGLYIARKIVELHRGRIYVESEPGAGATFIVELPPWNDAREGF